VRWTQAQSGRVTHSLEPLVLAAALAIIPVVVIQTDVHSGVWVTVASVANWVIWAIFLGELVFVLTVAERKQAAVRAHWLDLAVVVLTVPLLGRLLSAVRLVRLARLFRLVRLAAVAGRAMTAERRLTSTEVFRFVALVTGFVVVVAGAAEATVDKTDFPRLWDGIWWAVVTVTTVGYGDVYPRSTEGRIVAMFVMLFGIGFLSVLTATIASKFVTTDSAAEELRATLARIEAELAEVKSRLS
jgi:voltage-gated potassium channel